MGTNCAPWLANFYLFTYEWEFVKRLIASNHLNVLVRFRFTGRYLDDVISIDNPHLDDLLYFSPEEELVAKKREADLQALVEQERIIDSQLQALNTDSISI